MKVDTLPTAAKLIQVRIFGEKTLLRLHGNEVTTLQKLRLLHFQKNHSSVIAFVFMYAIYLCPVDIKCLISPSQHFPKLRYRVHAPKINLTPTFHKSLKHDNIQILHIYNCYKNITAQHELHNMFQS